MSSESHSCRKQGAPQVPFGFAQCRFSTPLRFAPHERGWWRVVVSHPFARKKRRDGAPSSCGTVGAGSFLSKLAAASQAAQNDRQGWGTPRGAGEISIL